MLTPMTIELERAQRELRLGSPDKEAYYKHKIFKLNQINQLIHEYNTLLKHNEGGSNNET